MMRSEHYIKGNLLTTNYCTWLGETFLNLIQYLKKEEYWRFFIPALGLWMNAGIFLLVFVIPMVEMAGLDVRTPIFGLGNQVLFVAQILAWSSLALFGHNMDKRRFNLDLWILGSLFGVSVGMFLLFFVPRASVAVLAYFILGISMGPLAIGLVEIYDELVDWRHRGKVFSLIILFFTGLMVVALAALRTVIDFLYFLPILGIVNLLLGLLYLHVSRTVPKTYHDRVIPAIQLSGYQEMSISLFTWKNILGRPTVRGYALSHVLVYFVIGVTITSVIDAGMQLGIKQARIDFWLVALLFDGIFVILAGYLTDKIGRKAMIIIGTYVIGVSGFLQGFLSDVGLVAFYVSAMGFGVGFSFIHVTLDSTVWADLAPRSATGKYYAVAYISLIFGLGWGIFLGLYFLPTSLMLTGIVILLASFIATLPLFLVEDSYPPLDPILVMIILESGVLLLSHPFHPHLQLRESVSDDETDDSLSLPLVAGAFSAIVAFMTTVTRSKGKTTIIRQVNQEILVKYHPPLMGVVFSNRITKELNDYLEQYLKAFWQEYHVMLAQWTGDVLPFRQEHEKIDEFFASIVPYKYVASIDEEK